MSDIVDQFISRNLLFETGRNQFYKNIVFIGREDKEYLRLLGKGMFDGFDKSLFKEMRDLNKTSYLLKTLKQESAFQLEDYKKVGFKSPKNLIENVEDDTILEATVDESYWQSGNNDIYTAMLIPENVMLYFPVLEGWIQYMLRNPKQMMNETFETREIIKCLSYPVQRWKNKRKLLLNLYNHDLIEKVKI